MKILTAVSVASLSVVFSASAFACEGYKPTDASAAPAQLNLASAPQASKLPAPVLEKKAPPAQVAGQPAADAATNTVTRTAQVAKN